MNSNKSMRLEGKNNAVMYLDRFFKDIEKNYEILRGYAKSRLREAMYWEGRFHVLRHENNKLRKENERLRKEIGE